MKTYIVASNVNFTTLCIAKSPTEALKKAAKLSNEKYGYICEGLTAYTAEEFIDDPNGIEIDII
jgi:hypothetical protein